MHAFLTDGEVMKERGREIRHIIDMQSAAEIFSSGLNYSRVNTLPAICDNVLQALSFFQCMCKGNNAGCIFTFS